MGVSSPRFEESYPHWCFTLSRTELNDSELVPHSIADWRKGEGRWSGNSFSGRWAWWKFRWTL